MKKLTYAVLAIALYAVSVPAFAQSVTTTNTNTVEGLIQWFINLINNALVPLVFALAFILFLFGVFKYFFGIGKNAEENRREGAKFILWAVIAFAVMISIWGIVKLVTNTVPGLQNQSTPCIPTFGGPCKQPSGGSNSSGTNGNPTVFGNDPSKLNAPGQPIGM